jgi:hypothetical protein
MKKVLAITVLWFLVPALAGAQNAAPSVEIFLGGSTLRQPGPYIVRDRNYGPTIGITANFNRTVGVELDLSAFPTAPLMGPPAFGDEYRALVGPHVAYNGDRHVSPFAHFLVGVTHGIQDCSYFDVPPLPGCDRGDGVLGSNPFTTDFGAGLDVKVFRFFWVRPLQVDWFHDFYSGAGKNRVELSFGATFRFGNKGKARGKARKD